MGSTFSLKIAAGNSEFPFQIDSFHQTAIVSWMASPGRPRLISSRRSSRIFNQIFPFPYHQEIVHELDFVIIIFQSMNIHLGFMVFIHFLSPFKGFNREGACLRLPVAFATQTGASPHRQAKDAKEKLF